MAKTGQAKRDLARRKKSPKSKATLLRKNYKVV